MSFFSVQQCHVAVRETRLHSSRAKQVITTVCVADALEGEGEES